MSWKASWLLAQNCGSHGQRVLGMWKVAEGLATSITRPSMSSLKPCSWNTMCKLWIRDYWEGSSVPGGCGRRYKCSARWRYLDTSSAISANRISNYTHSHTVSRANTNNSLRNRLATSGPWITSTLYSLAFAIVDEVKSRTLSRCQSLKRWIRNCMRRSVGYYKLTYWELRSSYSLLKSSWEFGARSSTMPSGSAKVYMIWGVGLLRFCHFRITHLASFVFSDASSFTVEGIPGLALPRALHRKVEVFKLDCHGCCCTLKWCLVGQDILHTF